MRAIWVALLLFGMFFDLCAQVRVNGYYRKNGTYVAPHYRSRPNSSRLDNYSTRGNYNPYTGKPGTVSPYPTPVYVQPSYVPPAATSTSEADRKAARAEVEELFYSWSIHDPNFEWKRDAVSGQVSEIGRKYPPHEWAWRVTNAWHSTVKPSTCASASEAANNLSAAAINLARCADRHDYFDGCAAEAGDAHSAAIQYEQAAVCARQTGID